MVRSLSFETLLGGTGKNVLNVTPSRVVVFFMVFSLPVCVLLVMLHPKHVGGFRGLSRTLCENRVSMPK